MTETFYDVLRRQGISRRSFLKFCSLTATSLGLDSSYAPRSQRPWKPSRARR
jgi:hydrogenase small subunit